MGGGATCATNIAGISKPEILTIAIVPGFAEDLLDVKAAAG
jgi:hypothetical protein